MNLELTKQNGDNNFSGEIHIGIKTIGRFEVKTTETPRSVEHIKYFIGDAKIKEQEAQTNIEVFDRLAYELDYDGFALPPLEDVFSKQIGKITYTLDEVVDEKTSDLANELFDAMGLDRDEDDNEDYFWEIHSGIRGAYFNYYTPKKDEALKKAENKIVELKKQLKGRNRDTDYVIYPLENELFDCIKDNTKLDGFIRDTAYEIATEFARQNPDYFDEGENVDTLTADILSGVRNRLKNV